MTLAQLLETLESNENTNIQLIDSTDKTLVIFNCAGWESIESDLGARVVKKVAVLSAAVVKVIIADA